MTDVNGLTPKEETVGTIDVSLTISDVSPNTGLNQLGGDILTLTGEGLDQITENTSVTFSDGTICIMQTTSASEATCMVDGFDPDTLDSSTPYEVTVTVNGVENTNPISVEILPEKQSGFSVSPTSASPVLSTILTVSLEDTYPEELLVEDFTARLVDQTNSTITRPLYVMSVDDSTKEIRIKFPGAESGNYYVQIESASIGRIDKTPLSLEVIGKITGISPTYGSIHGGTLVTIDGVNFSDDPLDNPVKVGDNYCLVETTSAN